MFSNFEERRRKRNSSPIEARKMEEPINKSKLDAPVNLKSDKKTGFNTNYVGGALQAASMISSAASIDSDPDSYMEEEMDDVGGINAAGTIASSTASGAAIGGPWGAAIGAGVGIATVGIQHGKVKKFNKRLQKKKAQHYLDEGNDKKLTFEKLQDRDKEKSLKYMAEMNTPQYNRFKRSMY